MHRIGVLTSGGDAPGMNAAIRAVTRAASQEGYEVYGIYDGYYGLVNNKIERIDTHAVSGIINRGGTILRTARLNEFSEPEVQARAAQNLQDWGIDSLVVIGGDGTFRGAATLIEHGINCMCIPGTIDNDLAYTDFTIGFDTAVNTVLGAINNLRDTMTSHGLISIVEVMGRNCGDIALYAGIAGGAEIILVPEKPINLELVARRVRADNTQGKHSDIIVLAEGAGDADEFKKTLQEQYGFSLRATTLGHVQRGGVPSMKDRILAARFGTKAIELIKEGKIGRAIGIKNNKVVDFDIHEALNMKKEFDEELYRMAETLSR